jgi:hypothetical protein
MRESFRDGPSEATGAPAASLDPAPAMATSFNRSVVSFYLPRLKEKRKPLCVTGYPP